MVDGYSDVVRPDDKDISSLWKGLPKETYSSMNDMSDL